MRRNFSVFFFLVILLGIAGPMRLVRAEGQHDRSGNAPFDMNTLRGDVSSALSQMDEALGPSPGDMTLEDEYYLGRAVASEILKTYKPYTGDSALTAYLNKICLTITVNSSKATLYSGYHVEILDTNEICAFASPGGHIFISRGLIACASSEDALAAVIAHEVAHIQHRHVAAMLESERTVNQLTAAADRAASMAARNLSAQEKNALLFRESLSVSVNMLFRDGYSRDQEFEADREARLLLIGSGYDPEALGEILGVLSQRSQPGNMSRTHPSPAERIMRLAGFQGQSGTGRSTLPLRVPRFNSALRR